jgi:hypothetical protein
MCLNIKDFKMFKTLVNRFILKYAGLSQPHFEGSVRSPLTLPKMGLGSPLGLPKAQSAIAGVKTLCIEVFFIPLERP